MSQAKREQLENLRQLRNSGLLSTTVDGESMTFRSMEELSKAIIRLEIELGERPRRKRYHSAFMGHR